MFIINFGSELTFLNEFSMVKGVLLFLMILIAHLSRGQVNDQALDSITEKLIIMEGDSILQSAIPLDEVYIFGKLKFSSYEDKLRYYILRRKTLKVYPYAKLASERLTELNDRLEKIESKSKRNRYTKIVQKYIEGEFSDELKKLTRTEGQILVKLIYRQTGETAYSLVQELRSGWRAFWYNSTAKMFDISIKEEFHPESVLEDYQIEDILQRAFAENRLEPQKSALDYDYASLTNKWNTGDKKKN
jgi:hypothetical protein